MKVEMDIMMSFLILFTARAFRWTSTRGAFGRATPTMKAMRYDIARTRSKNVINFYEAFFVDYSNVPGGECILPSVLKRRDLLGTTQLINPLSFEIVDVNDVLSATIATIETVLKQSPFSLEKGSIGAVRGSGGGKTIFMARLHQQLCAPEYKHILPVLITFGDKWGDNDVQRYKPMFPSNPERAFSLAVISRIASVCFAVPHRQIVDHIMEHKDAWQLIFDCEDSGFHIALFLIYLAQKRGATDIVLMVDEAHKCLLAVSEAYNSTYDYTFGLHWALLRHEILPEFGMRGAYVESGLRHTVAMGNDAGPRSYNIFLPELLNATTVTRNLFLSDLDSDGRLHAVTPCLDAGDNGTDVAFAWLCEVAAYYAHSPRALEFAQDYLRCRIDRTTVPRTLTVTSSQMQGLFEYVEQRLQETNPALFNHGAPSLEVLRGIMLQKHVYARPVVFEGIRNSLYVNSLRILWEFPPTSDKCEVRLRTTIQSLNAAVCNSPQVHLPDTIEYYLHNLCKIYREYVVSYPYASRERTLSDLSAAWLQLLATLAARTGTKSISVRDLLKIGRDCLEPRKLPDTKMFYFSEHLVTLPVSGVVPIYTLQSVFNTTGTSQPIAAAFDELNNLHLSAEVPCVVLKPAEGDCWGHGLAFLDETNTSRVVLVDTEIEESGDGSTPRCDAHYQLIQQNAALYVVKGARGNNLGDTIARGDYVYLCRTTTEGKSFVKDDVFVTLRANFVQWFYNVMYGPFLRVKGEEQKPEPLDIFDIRRQR